MIECINPEHLYLGSVHYIQPDCVGKWTKSVDLASFRDVVAMNEREIILNPTPADQERIFDSDESWQASEALLKGRNG